MHSDDESGYTIDYDETHRHPAKESLLGLMRNCAQKFNFNFNVSFGSILSGGARIFSSVYRDELVNNVPSGDEPVIGGEMEGVGLLSVSKREYPSWIVIKGISDFADGDRDKVIKETRPIACLNSALFVLTALFNYPENTSIEEEES